VIARWPPCCCLAAAHVHLSTGRRVPVGAHGEKCSPCENCYCLPNSSLQQTYSRPSVKEPSDDLPGSTEPREPRSRDDGDRGAQRARRLRDSLSQATAVPLPGVPRGFRGGRLPRRLP